MLTASYVLITLGGDAGPGPRRHDLRGHQPDRVGAASSSPSRFVYAATGTVNMADLAGAWPTLPDGLRTALSLLLLVVFGIKAAVFPLFFWLPDSYPTARAPGHRGVRRPAHQGRRLRHHPHPDPAVPADAPVDRAARGSPG